jgi:hypothetical protein
MLRNCMEIKWFTSKPFGNFEGKCNDNQTGQLKNMAQIEHILCRILAASFSWVRVHGSRCGEAVHRCAGTIRLSIG